MAKLLPELASVHILSSLEWRMLWPDPGVAPRPGRLFFKQVLALTWTSLLLVLGLHRDLPAFEKIALTPLETGVGLAKRLGTEKESEFAAHLFSCFTTSVNIHVAGISSNGSTRCLNLRFPT